MLKNQPDVIQRSICPPAHFTFPARPQKQKITRRRFLPQALHPAREPPFSVPLRLGNGRSIGGAAAEPVYYWPELPELRPPAPPGRGFRADLLLPWAPAASGRPGRLKGAGAGSGRWADCSLQTNLGISESHALVPTETGKPNAGGAAASACHARCTCRKSLPLLLGAVSRVTIRGRDGQNTLAKNNNS